MRGHAASALFASFALLGLAASCTDSDADQPDIPARPGAEQPPGSGSVIPEDEACGRLVDAEEDARQRLVCARLEHAECPFYVRPAGSGCWEYYENSVAACEDFIADYTTCSDFTDRPCVITAVLAAAQSCPEFGEGGAGGASGEGGGTAGGEGGAPGGGVPGVGGEAGDASGPAAGGAPSAGEGGGAGSPADTGGQGGSGGDPSAGGQGG